MGRRGQSDHCRGRGKEPGGARAINAGWGTRAWGGGTRAITAGGGGAGAATAGGGGGTIICACAECGLGDLLRPPLPCPSLCFSCAPLPRPGIPPPPFPGLGFPCPPMPRPEVSLGTHGVSAGRARIFILTMQGSGKSGKRQQGLPIHGEASSLLTLDHLLPDEVHDDFIGLLLSRDAPLGRDVRE